MLDREREMGLSEGPTPKELQKGGWATVQQFDDAAIQPLLPCPASPPPSVPGSLLLPLVLSCAQGCLTCSEPWPPHGCFLCLLFSFFPSDVQEIVEQTLDDYLFRSPPLPLPDMVQCP